MSILDRVPPQADHRLPYGSLPLQYGDLWLPAASIHNPSQRWPLLIFVHGGWWKSVYDLEYASFLCQAMKARGVAVWSLEYRRVGDAGGGWPGTMQDVASGADHVAQLASQFPIDLNRIAAAGHSAGGQLAFWLAGRHHIPHTSPLAEPQPKIMPKSVVSLAGAVDLRLTIELGGILHFTSGPPAVEALMGGSPDQVPDRYAAANPGQLLPLNLPQILIRGTADDQIPPQLPQRWATAARRQGDSVQVDIIPGADHFDIVDPESKTWWVTQDALLKSVSA